MEKFSKKLLWRAGLFFALYDEFHLAKKGIKLLKIIPCWISRLFSWRLGEGGLIYSALKWWQISEDDRWHFVNEDSGYTPNRLM